MKTSTVPDLICRFNTILNQNARNFVDIKIILKFTRKSKILRITNTILNHCTTREVLVDF